MPQAFEHIANIDKTISAIMKISVETLSMIVDQHVIPLTWIDAPVCEAHLQHFDMLRTNSKFHMHMHTTITKN